MEGSELKQKEARRKRCPMTLFIRTENRCRSSKHFIDANAARAGLVRWIATFAVALWTPTVRADLTTVNATEALASLTGADVNACEELLVGLTGADPATLLQGLAEGEAAELLELIADLTGLSAPASSAGSTVGKVARPEFRKMARDLEEGMADHLWYGQIFLDVTYGTPEKTPGDVVGLGGG